MFLKKIQYDDFRPFRGHHELSFSANPNKNITVILGDNTFGKSTFVLSFIWAFYGESRFKLPEEMLNKQVESAMMFGETKSTKVSIDFTHDDEDYFLVREQSFRMGNDGKLYASPSALSIQKILENGLIHRFSLIDGQNVIKEILPKELSSYFFFEGEKSETFSTQKLESAVQNLLGLTTLARAKEFLHGNTNSVSSKSVMGYFEGLQNDSSNVEATLAYRKKQEAEAQLDGIKQQISDLNSQIETYEQRSEEINEILRKNASTADKQQRRDSLHKLIEGEKEELTKAYKRMVEDFNDGAASFFLLPLMEKAKKRLTELELSDKGIRNMDSTSIDDIIKRGVCVCGTEIKEGTAAYRQIKKEQEYLPPQHIGLLARGFIETIDAQHLIGTQFANGITDDYQRIMQCLTKINEWEKEEASLIKELEGKANSQKYAEELQECLRRLKDLRDQKEGLFRDEVTLANTIEVNTNRYNELVKSSEKNEELKLLYDYADELYQWVSTEYDDREKEMRSRLQKIVSDIFNRMYHGHREIIIDHKYNSILLENGKALAGTGGLDIVKYFSFIGGLVKLAREVLHERKNSDTITGGEEYPLVLDAAFSNADSRHVSNISKILPEVTNQLIFAVMEKDWMHAENVVREKLGKVYKLEKISESEVAIKMVMEG